MRIINISLCILFCSVGCADKNNNDAQNNLDIDEGIMSNTVVLTKSSIICKEESTVDIAGCWITPDCASDPPFSSRRVISFDDEGFIRNTSIHFNDSNCLGSPLIVKDSFNNNKMARNYSVTDVLVTEEGLEATVVSAEIEHPASTLKYFSYFLKGDGEVCFSSGTFEFVDSSSSFNLFDSVPTTLDLDYCLSKYTYTER